MKRPMLLFAVSNIAGILTGYILNSYFMGALAFFILLVLITCLRKLLKGKILLAIAAVLIYLIGAVEYIYVYNACTVRFTSFDGEHVVIRGMVDSEPDIRETGISYIVRVEEITFEGENQALTGRIILTTPSGSKIYPYGRQITIQGELELPDGARNPGGFNYRSYLVQKDVSALVYAREYNIEEGEIKSYSILRKIGVMLRERIVGTIESSLPEQQAGLLNGMLIGYREGLTQEIEDVFRDAGLSHLMAVSGANVAFIAAPLVFILRKLRLGKRVINIIVIAALGIFICITGFEPSVVRAVIMADIILTGRIIMREPDTLSSLSLAALIMLFYNPCTLFNIGFQLSFAATVSLVLLYRNISRMININIFPRGVVDILSATLAAQIGVLPVTVVYFNNVPVISLVTNLLAAPAAGLITVLGCLMAVIGQISTTLSTMVGYVNCALLSFVLWISKIAASVPWAVIKVATPPLLIIIVYYLIVWFILWYKPQKALKLKLAHYAALLVAVAVIVITPLTASAGLEIVFIDVGQGDSALIRTGSGRTVLIDGGGHNSDNGSGSNIGNKIVIPFLLDYGVTSLDLVIATHGHNDHIEGLIAVLGSFNVKNFAIPACSRLDEFHELLRIAKEKNIKVSMLGRGDTLKLDGKTEMKVLSPGESAKDIETSLNNTSIVLKLSYGETEVLFTGDAEKEVEEELTMLMDDIGADVLKLAHHGSDTSTGSEFLKLVKPKAAIISVGTDNKFGHPSDVVLDRLKEFEIQVFRTDKHGAVILATDGKKIWFKKTIN